MILGLHADQLIFIVIMVVSTVLFVTEYFRVDLVALLIVFALGVSRIIRVDEAFSGFSSEPAIIVAAVFVLSAGLSGTGVTDVIGDWITRLSGKGETRSIFVIMTAVAIMSAFTHHLMVTAMLLPIIMKITKKEENLHASRLLIPMATSASLGTTLTLIGAPAFLLANNILIRSGSPALGLFSIGLLGGPLVVTGILYALLMRWVLPKTSGADDSDDQFKLTEITTELALPEGSRWIGKSIGELLEATRNRFDLQRWQRDGSNLDRTALDSKLEETDTLIIKTSPDELVSMDAEFGLVLKALKKFQNNGVVSSSLSGEEKRILKAVIAPRSEFVGRSVVQIDFHRRHGVVIVAIWRKSGWVSAGVTDTILQPGDMLVIWGPKEKLDDLSQHHGFLMLLPFYGTSTKRSKAKVATMIMLATVGAAAAGLLPAYLAFVGGALAMILTGCADIKQAYSAIEVKIFVMIAGVIPLGIAMERTKVDQLLAHQVLALTSGWQPYAMLLVLFWISAFLTQILSDAATTVLLAPIAVAFAKGASISPVAAVICVTVGAVASFLTPLGHHGNLLILSPGGYRFNDFLKMGLPLTLLISLLTCFLSLRIWT